MAGGLKHSANGAEDEFHIWTIMGYDRGDATGVDVIHGLIVRRIGSHTNTGVALEDRRTWFSALSDLFELTFEASPPGTTDRLWERTVSAHQRWQASQQQA